VKTLNSHKGSFAEIEPGSREMVDEITKASLLYDFYGALLTKKQRQVMALYHEENLSLSEIAQEFGISRQAVHDTLKKAEQALEDYESKLNLIDKLLKTDRAIALIEEEIAGIEAVSKEKDTVDGLKRIKRIIEEL
jgi:predicted DNA-binding protein YlxM (UPF0122 family)